MVLSLCNSNLSFIFKIIKYLITILKLIVPIALIVMATIDVAKIVMNPDDYGGGKTYTDSWMSCIAEILR